MQELPSLLKCYSKKKKLELKNSAVETRAKLVTKRKRMELNNNTCYAPKYIYLLFSEIISSALTKIKLNFKPFV
jgi:hypothetical protein